MHKTIPLKESDHAPEHKRRRVRSVVPEKSQITETLNMNSTGEYT